MVDTPLYTEQDKRFLAALKSKGYTKEDAFAALDKVKAEKGVTSTPTPGFLKAGAQNIVDQGAKVPLAQDVANSEALPSKIQPPATPKDPFNPLPVEGAETDLLDKVAQYGGPVGQAASGIAKSTLDNAEQGLKTVGQGVKTLGESSKITSGEDIAKNVGGIADIIGGGLSTVFAPLTAVTQKTPVVNTLFEKIGQGQDALSSFLADKIGTTEEEKIALQKSFNNLMNLGVIKYGPKVTEKAAPYVSDAATSLKSAVSDIAGDIKSSPLGKTASGFTNWTSEKLSGMTGKVRGSTESVIKSNLDGLTKIENKLKSVSNFINDAKSKGIDVKQIVSETDLLKDAVDADGNIKTMQPGGAVSQIKDAMKPADGVVMKALEAEGKTIPLSEVGDYMKGLIDQNSGLFGKAVDLAKSKVDAEIAGLAKYTDANGNIKLSDLQKFKVAKGKTINYSDPEAAIIEKDLVRGAKELIEQNTSSIDVKAINRELQTLYTVQEFLELLDNKKVQGARLGKYFAQTVGTVVGSAFGPLSAIMGGELSKFLYGKSMQGTFKGSTGGELGLSEQMKSAIDQSSKKDGNLNTNQSTTSMNTTTPIQDTVLPPSGKSNFNTAGAAESASLPKTKDVVKLGESKTNMSLIEAAKKYKSAEEFVKAQTDKSYRSAHQVDTKTSVPVTEIDEAMLSSFVDEFKKQYGYPSLKQAELNKLKSIIKNPDKEVTIYRASPQNELNSGDWVTIDRTYANDIKRQNGGKVNTYTVKASDLFYPKTIEGFKDLPSLNKWGAFQYQSSSVISKLTDIWNKAHGK